MAVSVVSGQWSLDGLGSLVFGFDEKPNQRPKAKVLRPNSKNPLTSSGSGSFEIVFVVLLSRQHRQHDPRPATGVVVPSMIVSVAKHCDKALYLTTVNAVNGARCWLAATYIIIWLNNKAESWLAFHALPRS
jgi:hypothetical protein